MPCSLTIFSKPHFRLDFSRQGSARQPMRTAPAIHPDHARQATEALLNAMTDVLEFAVDQCAVSGAPGKIPAIGERCRDVAVLADASVVILRRSASRG